MFETRVPQGSTQLVQVPLEDLNHASWDVLIAGLKSQDLKVSYPEMGQLAEKIVKAALRELTTGGSSGLIYSNTVSDTISNSAVETAFVPKKNLSGNAWQIGQLIRIRGYGLVSSLAGSEPQIAFRFRLGPLAGTALSGQTGLAAHVIAGAATGLARISNLTGMTVNSIGHTLTFTGSVNSENNGSFPIAAFVSATSVDVKNPNAIIPDAGNIVWTEKDSSLLLSSGYLQLPDGAVDAPWVIQAEIVCRTVGQYGRLMTTGFCGLAAGGASTALANDIAVILNDTADKDLQLTAQFTDADPDNSVTLQNLLVERYAVPTDI